MTLCAFLVEIGKGVASLYVELPSLRLHLQDEKNGPNPLVPRVQEIKIHNLAVN